MNSQVLFELKINPFLRICKTEYSQLLLLVQNNDNDGLEYDLSYKILNNFGALEDQI